MRIIFRLRWKPDEGRFLYYESGSHAWPKSNNKRPHTNQQSNTAESVEWFAKQIELADVYDNLNDDVLTNTLPLYVRDDESNEPVIMFTHMIFLIFVGSSLES